MGYDLRNAALIGCCVLAIVVAAAFFPAAGYGDAPDRDAVGSDHYGDALDRDAGDGSSGDDAPLERGLDGVVDAVSGEGWSDDPAEEPADDEPEAASDSSSPDRDASDEPASSSSGQFNHLLGSLLTLGVLGIGVVVGVLGAVSVWRATEPARLGVPESEIPSGALPRLWFRLGLIPQATMVVAIGASRTLPSFLDAVAGGSRVVGTSLSLVASGVGRGLGATLAGLPSLLTVSWPRIGLSSSVSGLHSVLSGIGPRSSRSDANASRTRRSRASTGDDAVDAPDTGPPTVEEAWAEMIDLVPVRRRRGRTPGEYARAAIDAGLPVDPVSRLTEVFREVRYGGYPPSADRTRRARDALERIERERDDGGDGE
ncbi:DUF4129 domain-containing protein [Natronobeatus ordinarius]|uniref:DUF4129 domain-containing protein n=1 Tax=Natronobeatus ordinarius TaxID=2963433 RepID=UPI0020CE4EDC|nr:DUF4129 domain-containing protein [Natronobeatus ordinarius]